MIDGNCKVGYNYEYLSEVNFMNDNMVIYNLISYLNLVSLIINVKRLCNIYSIRIKELGGDL